MKFILLFCFVLFLRFFFFFKIIIEYFDQFNFTVISFSVQKRIDDMHTLLALNCLIFFVCFNYDTVLETSNSFPNFRIVLNKHNNDQ